MLMQGEGWAEEELLARSHLSDMLFIDDYQISELTI